MVFKDKILMHPRTSYSQNDFLIFCLDLLRTGSGLALKPTHAPGSINWEFKYFLQMGIFSVKYFCTSKIFYLFCIPTNLIEIFKKKTFS